MVHDILTRPLKIIRRLHFILRLMYFTIPRTFCNFTLNKKGNRENKENLSVLDCIL